MPEGEKNTIGKMFKRLFGKKIEYYASFDDESLRVHVERTGVDPVSDLPRRIEGTAISLKELYAGDINLSGPGITEEDRKKFAGALVRHVDLTVIELNNADMDKITESRKYLKRLAEELRKKQQVAIGNLGIEPQQSNITPDTMTYERARQARRKAANKENEAKKNAAKPWYLRDW